MQCIFVVTTLVRDALNSNLHGEMLLLTKYAKADKSKTYTIKGMQKLFLQHSSHQCWMGSNDY